MSIIFNENNIAKTADSPLLVVNQHIEVVNSNSILTPNDKKLMLTNEEVHILKLI